VSTPDLLPLYPGATWLPNPVPLEDPDHLPVPSRGDARVVVSHSPTRKDLKNTSEFLRVMRRISRSMPEVQAEVIEMTEHRECLARKQRSDISFDHMQGYFGLSSLQTLAQGVPTIAGLDEWNIRCIRKFSGADELPWVIARDEVELETQIRWLASDADARSSTGTSSRRWMERHWSERGIMETLTGVYEQAACHGTLAEVP
jgi:hypothetical protein